jgi:S1-C subfamily serine protease
MKIVIALFVAAMLGAQPVLAQVSDTAGLWRAFAEKVEVGSSLKVRLHDGRKFTATLVQAQPGALLLQPKTRVPVAVQPVPYESIVSIERVRNGGIGAGKAAAIGVATGVGAFFATLLIFIAAIDD